MRIKNLKFIFLVVVATALFSFDIPKGWFQAGTPEDRDKYEIGTVAGGVDGGNVAYIKSLKKKIKGIANLMQHCSAGQYLGKRIRFSGYLKTEDVKIWTSFWLRVDGRDSLNKYKALSFDNMNDRLIKGTNSWKKYEIVLDVPSDATSMSYGTMLQGTGQVWIDNIKIEIVDSSVPTTGAWRKQPSNLSFDEH